jgi:hypothetical protein
MGKIVYEESVIDNHLHEKRTNLQIVKLPTEPPFVKLYLEDVALLHKLTTNCSSILYELLNYMDYQGELIITPVRRRELSEKLGISERTFKNQLAILTKKRILKNRSYLTYLFNPDLFAKGAWADVNRLRKDFRLTIDYVNGKRKIVAKEI